MLVASRAHPPIVLEASLIIKILDFHLGRLPQALGKLTQMDPKPRLCISDLAWIQRPGIGRVCVQTPDHCIQVTTRGLMYGQNNFRKLKTVDNDYSIILPESLSFPYNTTPIKSNGQ